VKLGFREPCEPETVVEPIPAALARREGRRRNPTDWTYNNIPQTHLFDRGFTGHSLSRHEVVGKHLDNFDLINMNGRVYDPWLGRFLSPDNFVQSATYSQNFNPYSYALNNPLKYTDPSGEFWNFVIGAGIGGVVGYISGRTTGLRSWDLTYYTIASAAIGAISSGVGTAASSAISISASGFASGAVSGAVGGFAGGFIAGTYMTGLNNVMYGQNNNAFVAGLKAGAIGAVGGFIIGGVSGGIYAKSHGRDFWTGKGTIEYFDVTGKTNYKESLRIAESYNKSDAQIYDTEFTKEFVSDTWGIKEGDFGIEKITTKAGKNIGYSQNGLFAKPDGSVAAGYRINTGLGKSAIHISRWATKDIVHLEATAGHEIIHAIHHSMISFVNQRYSESVAYHYSASVYFKNGYFSAGSYALLRGNTWSDYISVPSIYKLSGPYIVGF